jgi:WhiB family redox-sensing transcriptional regulator
MKNTEWMAEAACVGCDPEMFFPQKTGNGARVEAKLAILICRECPVIVQCREYARTAARGHGVWAGSVGGRGGTGRPPGRPKRREVA